MTRGTLFIRRWRELPCVVAFVVLLLVLAVAAPDFFRGQNLHDLLVNTAPTLIVALGMTVVILTGEIDISVGSQFAVCSVAIGWLAKTGVPILALPLVAIAVGAVLGAGNGLLVARLKVPSIIATLATFIAWRDALLWITGGAWVQNLPQGFQWLGFGQHGGEWLIVLCATVLLVVCATVLRYFAGGRAVYAVGCDREASRLAGLEPGNVVFGAFLLMGALSGFAALLNATRFTAIPSNLGAGLELRAIAAVVVGGTSITGGSGSVIGSLFGTLLLGSISTALVFAGINPFWEKAIQGSIILTAIFVEASISRFHKHHAHFGFSRTAGA
jgi:rhamnose transport system permease protein